MGVNTLQHSCSRPLIPEYADVGCDGIWHVAVTVPSLTREGKVLALSVDGTVSIACQGLRALCFASALGRAQHQGTAFGGPAAGAAWVSQAEQPSADEASLSFQRSSALLLSHSCSLWAARMKRLLGKHPYAWGLPSSPPGACSCPQCCQRSVQFPCAAKQDPGILSWVTKAPCRQAEGANPALCPGCARLLWS